MVSKKILAVAVATALSSSAFAVDFDLTDSNSAARKVAKSTVSETGKVTVSSSAASAAGSTTGAAGDYYVVTKNDTNLDIDVVGKVGIGLAADQKIYVRVDLTNAVFKTAVSNTFTASTSYPDLVVSDSSNADVTAAAFGVALGTVGATNVYASVDTISKGGAQGDRYVVFTVSPESGAKFEVADTFRFSFTNIAAAGGADAGATVSFYSSIDNATQGVSPLSTSSTSKLISFVEGVKTTVTPSTLTASADDLFKKFDGLAYSTSDSTGLGELGKIEIAPEAGVVAADGTTLTFGKLFDVADGKSSVTLKGDFSTADFVVGTGNCTTAQNFITKFVKDDATATSNNNKTTGKLNAEYKIDLESLGAVTGDTSKDFRFCAKKADNGTVLLPTDFTATVTYDKVAKDASPAVTGKAAGTINQNGVTIQVPYITTFADYNQRLVLVNRGTTDVAYSIAFTPDVATGATATAGAAATGTLKAGKTTVLKSTDVVTIAGSTRTAATITVVGATGKISAATTTVNLSDKSTDTVILKQ